MPELQNNRLRAPFPWFGGKSRAAHLVWPRLGSVRTYVEPFFGSGAVLLARKLELARLGIEWSPGQTIETVNDADAYVANFWRAVGADPCAVAHFADSPVNEAELHARHRWLVALAEHGFREQVMGDPDFFDAKVAGWWVWGLSCWIGAGWCCVDGSTRQQGRKRPDLQRNGQGLGVHARALGRGDRGPRRLTGEVNKPKLQKLGGVHAKRPVVGADNLGRGAHPQLPRVHSQGGIGIHGHRVPLKRPQLTGNGGGIGVHSTDRRNHLEPWFEELQHRFRPVRVVCGDFERVCGPSVVLPDTGVGAIFLDPPYPANADRQEELYSVDCGEVAHRAHVVALKWGEHPRVRVAFCGYEGSHTFPGDWECVAWKTAGGYGRGKRGRGEANRHRERIWFSPACLQPAEQLALL